MLHPPLSNAFPIPCSSATISESSEIYQADLTALKSAVPFLTKPLLAIAGFSSPNRTAMANSPANPQFGVANSPSLSGSSSLSSSLISLHSTPNGCITSQQTSVSSLPVHSNYVPSGGRDSRWLKLRTNSNQSENESKINEDKCCIKLENPNTKVSCSTDSGQNENGSSFHCTILGTACPYAHPPVTVRVDNGYVTVCYDFIKRKLCKFSYCKYYHPPPHQIEAIIKRGDEQRKLLESQQRLSELKTSNLIPMQPLQQTLPTGLPTLSSIPGTCPAALRWPPTTLLQPAVGGSVYGTYLTPLNSLSDQNSLNASTLLAAAVLQHTSSGPGLLSTSSTLTGGAQHFPRTS
ncbi:unnamed protein product [Heterobilharzia americana]|nr:unnamed protein product [Heterobilharzia americana]